MKICWYHGRPILTESLLKETSEWKTGKLNYAVALFYDHAFTMVFYFPDTRVFFY